MAFKIIGKTRPMGTEKYPTPASTLIGIGTPLKLSADALALCAAGDVAWFLAQGTKASTDSATTAIEVVPVRQFDVYLVDVGTGTMANSYVGSTCDLKSGAAYNIDLTADSHHDVTIVGWDGVDTTHAYVRFNKTYPATA